MFYFSASCVNFISFLFFSFVLTFLFVLENSYRKQLMVDDVLATLDILDTAGQEEYAVMRHQYIRQGQGFALVFSVASRDTFDSMGDFYEQIMDVKGGDKPAILLLANKVDLPPEERQVSNEDGQVGSFLRFSFLFFFSSLIQRLEFVIRLRAHDLSPCVRRRWQRS